MKWFVAALLAAGSALAQEQPIPAHAWSVGGGVFGAVALTHDIGDVKGDLALSLAATYETPYFFAGIEGMAGELAQQRPIFYLGVMRAGFTIPDLPHAPFFAIGLGTMQQKLRGAVNADGTGVAFTGELGVLLFRDREWGRGTISLMGVSPTFSVAGTNIPLAIFGARLML